jgi:hypothetical protein
MQLRQYYTSLKWPCILDDNMLGLFALVGSLFAWALGVIAAFMALGFRWGSLGAIGLTALFWKQLMALTSMALLIWMVVKTQM